ncbi:MAG: hypothetical protein Q7R96_02030, partial [Nanoarchaeota archaeon]|nr:hypothetical protein [Nanoarchaeota archaeon]
QNNVINLRYNKRRLLIKKKVDSLYLFIEKEIKQNAKMKNKHDFTDSNEQCYKDTFGNMVHFKNRLKDIFNINLPET